MDSGSVIKTIAFHLPVQYEVTFMTLRSEVNNIMTLTTWLSNFNWQHQLSTVSMNSQICQAPSRKQVWTSNKMQILQGKEFGSTAWFQGVATFCVHTIAAIDKNTDRLYACNVYHKVSNIVWWISGKWAETTILTSWIFGIGDTLGNDLSTYLFDVLTILAQQERECKGSDPVLKSYNTIAQTRDTMTQWMGRF